MFTETEFVSVLNYQCGTLRNPKSSNKENVKVNPVIEADEEKVDDDKGDDIVVSDFEDNDAEDNDLIF